MLSLHLAPQKGPNPSARFFPHSGFLGLTPVIVEGIVRTKFEQDRKPLPAKSLSISVRCYEVSRSRGAVLLVDHTHVLWQKPPASDYADLAEVEFPFKFTFPEHTAGPSTANFQVYRTFWRVEAILEHIPIFGVGHRLVRYFDLPLVRYDVPSHPLLPASPPHALHLQTSKPRAPVLRYTVSTPTHPVGPNDIVFASLFVQPLDPNVSVRSATLVVERRIDLLNPPPSPASPPPTHFSGPYLAPDDIPTSPTSSSTQLDVSSSYESTVSVPSPLELTPSTSATTLDSYASSSRPLVSAPPMSPTQSSLSPDTPAKTLTSTILTTECTGFTCDAAGMWSKTTTLQWPAARAQSRWALGETMHSEHVAVRFFLRVTARVAGPAGSDTLELEPRELVVAATSEAERRVALTQYAEQRAGTGRSKSKSPWRARHADEREEDERAAAAQQAQTFPGAAVERREGHRLHQHHRSAIASGSHPSSSGKVKAPKMRRPHTSAGPSDKSNIALGMGEGMRMVPAPTSSRREQEREWDGVHRNSRESGLGESIASVAGQGQNRERERERERAREKEKEKEKERQAKMKERTPVGHDQVRAWEEELARIEVQSRRSSAHMLGSWGLPFGRRKTSAVLQRG
ncbi:hypothetical protein IEO21_00532 [Rhodonia placenta]|uniref:Uncharacterized protein n=1 Tax=Rhodonia placenta TaxID=104341 RepID=A0A8H7PBP7_9APHY|nr:hypothetical protein IEO21_00532 [Postia placenta]